MNTTTGIPVVDTFFTKVETLIINPLITLLALAAFVLFVYGVVEYIRNAENEEKRGTGQQHMVWGIIGLVILFGAATIVKIIGATSLSLFK